MDEGAVESREAPGGWNAWLEDPLRVVRRPDRRHRLAGHDGRPRGQALDQGRGGARDRRRLRPQVRRLAQGGGLGRRRRVRRRARPWAPGRRTLRKAGKPVVGGSPYTDKLEDDRAFGQQELKAAGVSIIPQENFTSFDDAIAYVRRNPNRYVIKPSGEAQNYKRLLFVGEEEDGRDVVQVLEDYKRAWSEEDQGVPAPAPDHGRRGRDRRLLQRQGVRDPDLRELRAQEAVPGRHRAVDRRDGHRDVLERAQQDLQRHAQEDGAEAAPRSATSATSTSTAS